MTGGAHAGVTRPEYYVSPDLNSQYVTPDIIFASSDRTVSSLVRTILPDNIYIVYMPLLATGIQAC